VNVLSLFSGIGGLDLGLERAGFTITGQVEIDPWCRKVLEKHWPEVPRHEDVRTAAGWWGGRPAPDVVAGGFPCQPVSLAGKGLAQADPRWLWPAFAGIIRDLRPRYVLVENVPGLLGRGMGDVLGDLASLGYDASWDCLSAADFGAVHLRKRIWIVAYAVRGELRDEPGRRNGQDRPGASVAGDDGAACVVADATGARRAPGPGGTSGQARDETWRPRPDGLGSALADTASTRPPDGRTAQGRRSSAPRWVEPERLGWWAAEPGVGRVADGIPGRVDRLRGLGNAVVPQVAEHIGRMIMDAERAA
jgi:DNA (cytosine-5)-methyltransferase 1